MSFVKTYAGKAATTEDFQGDGRETHDERNGSYRRPHHDWFFNEYVYGTALPSYSDFHIRQNRMATWFFGFQVDAVWVDDKFGCRPNLSGTGRWPHRNLGRAIFGWKLSVEQRCR